MSSIIFEFFKSDHCQLKFVLAIMNFAGRLKTDFYSRHLVCINFITFFDLDERLFTNIECSKLLMFLAACLIR